MKCPTSTPTATHTPTPGSSISFYRAVNVNGLALVLDGNPYDAGTAANFTTNGIVYNTAGGGLIPATDPVRAKILSTSVYYWTLNMTMSAVPNGSYDVYVYVYSSWPQSYTLSLQGQQVYTNPNSGSTGTWQKIGPFTTTVTNGTINLTSGGNIVHVSGLEVWQHTPPVPTFKPPTNTRTRTSTRTPIGAVHELKKYRQLRPGHLAPLRVSTSPTKVDRGQYFLWTKKGDKTACVR